ncbi:cytochrome P450 [Streptomyces kronopolitis]|uniref:cytochrome P450 n=1 Tax=Streptomyces kronopolitis TaxID=1612435 RepID=UPI003D96E0B9
MRIPGPEYQEDGGLGAVAAAGGLHRYQLRLHEEHGPVVRFQLPGADTAVSVADPVLLEATAHLDTRPEIRDTVMVTLLAAHHTTGVAVAWTLHLLGHHPAVADRVAAELDRVLGERAMPAYGDLRRLPYLDMVLKESMRLFPPGPYGARETTEDLVLGPYEIPAGTTVFYPFWAVHLNPEHWPEPERFDPERFTPQEVAKRPRLAYVPFGIGPRSCEGAALATVETRLVLAVLLKRLRFRPVPGHEVTPVGTVRALGTGRDPDDGAATGPLKIAVSKRLAIPRQPLEPVDAPLVQQRAGRDGSSCSARRGTRVAPPPDRSARSSSGATAWSSRRSGPGDEGLGAGEISPGGG